MLTEIRAATWFGVVQPIMSGYSIHEVTNAVLKETLHQETRFPRARTEEPNWLSLMTREHRASNPEDHD